MCTKNYSCTQCKDLDWSWLNPVSTQSAHRWLTAGRRLHAITYTRLIVTLTAAVHHSALPNYTASSQRHMCVNNLPRVIMWKWNSRESYPRPLNCKSSALAIVTWVVEYYSQSWFLQLWCHQTAAWTSTCTSRERYTTSTLFGPRWRTTFSCCTASAIFHRQGKTTRKSVRDESMTTSKRTASECKCAVTCT